MFVPLLYNLDVDQTQTSIQFDVEYIVPVTNSFVIDSKEDLNTYNVSNENFDFRFPNVITSININDDEVKSEIKNENDFSIMMIPRQKITMKAKIASVKYIKKPIFLN